MLRGSGFGTAENNIVLVYMLFNDGVLVDSGLFSQTIQAQYLGFSDGIFDEILLRDSLDGWESTMFNGSFNALAIDSIELASPVPEPATLFLLDSGVAGLAFYRRKRK